MHFLQIRGEISIFQFGDLTVFRSSFFFPHEKSFLLNMPFYLHFDNLLMYNLKGFFQSISVFVEHLKKAIGIKCITFSSTAYFKKKSIATFTVNKKL